MEWYYMVINNRSPLRSGDETWGRKIINVVRRSEQLVRDVDVI